MGAALEFEFDHRVEFLPESSEEILRGVPAGPGVFALRGARAEDGAEPEPYLTRTANLRRRLRRLLAPPEALDEQGRPVLSKRLNLRDKVRRIEWTRTGSEFESTLVLYGATRAAFGAAEARRRLRLHPPHFVRLTMQHEHPRVYVTNRLSRRALPESFGPFPSRAAAERCCDAVLDLFRLRRCHEDLQVHPEHPGCAYGEMNKCMAPCKVACTAGEYAAEAQRVFAFFATRGESMLREIAAQREVASEAMDFEAAAALHKQWERVRGAAMLFDEVVRPVEQVRALIVQEAAPQEAAERMEEAAVFLLDGGRLSGPERLSTLGVRAVREQTAVGSSLFAQPLMLAAVPLAEAGSGETGAPEAAPAGAARTPEERATAAIEALQARAEGAGRPELPEFADALSLFRRWYFRPEKQRAGAVLLPSGDGSWSTRRLLNAAARVVLGPPAAAPPVDREAAAAVKKRLIHAGRDGVEREVPVLPKRKRPARNDSSRFPAEEALPAKPSL